MIKLNEINNKTKPVGRMQVPLINHQWYCPSYLYSTFILSFPIDKIAIPTLEGAPNSQAGQQLLNALAQYSHCWLSFPGKLHRRKSDVTPHS